MSVNVKKQNVPYAVEQGAVMSEKAEDGLSELRKCPFCGGEPSVRDYFNNKFGAGRISCSTVGCYARMTYTGTASKKKVAEAWNRRALRSESVRAGVIEECARVCRKLRGDGDAPTDRLIGFDMCEEAIRALKSAPNEMAEMPERRRLSDAGTVRVPREPTMGQWDDFCAVHHVPFDKFIVAYKAMLAAALSGGRS
jgi:Lar family restriction alleviation protein